MAVLAIFTPMTGKKEERLEWIPYIEYLVTFKNQTKTLLNSRSKVNAINSAFAYQLGPKISKTNIKTQKIDSTTFKTYKMVVSIFLYWIKIIRRDFLKKASCWLI